MTSRYVIYIYMAQFSTVLKQSKNNNNNYYYDCIVVTTSIQPGHVVVLLLHTERVRTPLNIFPKIFDTSSLR